MSRQNLANVAIGLVAIVLGIVVNTQNWRVLQQRETIYLEKGPPVSFGPGTAVCTDGTLPAYYDPFRRAFRSATCPPLIVFTGGFE